MIPNGGNARQMFNVMVAYLRNNGSFDSPFVKTFQISYGVTEKELKDWVKDWVKAGIDAEFDVK